MKSIALVDGDIAESIGHTWLGANGYVCHSIGGGHQQLVHRTVAEKALGRLLGADEHVHHIDYNKLNNQRSNLIICDAQYHRLLHARQDCLNDGYSPDTHRYCTYHKQYEEKDQFSFVKSAWDGRHNMCRAATNAYRKAKGLNIDKFTWKARMDQQYRRSLRSGLCSPIKEGTRP